MKKIPLLFSSLVLLFAFTISGWLNQANATPKCLMQEKKDTGKSATCLTCHNAKLPKKDGDTSRNQHGEEHQKTDNPCHKKS